MFPFLFCIQDPGCLPYYMVVISSQFAWDLYQPGWTSPGPKIPLHGALVPIIAAEQERHRFDTEGQALKFLREWWAAHPVEVRT